MKEICPACTLMFFALNTEHRCCMNCRFSYFRPLEEDGMCWCPEHVKGSIQPKAVQEFYLCSLWQKRK